MQRAKRPVLGSLLAFALMLAGMTPTVSSAQQSLQDDEPGELATIGDAIFARPALLLATGVGLTLYTATLPFSILGGSEEEAAETLVLTPGEATFRRCLGCTPAQEQQRRIEARTRKANLEKNEEEPTTSQQAKAGEESEQAGEQQGSDESEKEQ
jgi:hypothetical protein